MPEIGPDADDQHADQAADQQIRHPRLEAGTGIPAGQPADAQRDAVVKVRGHRARRMERQEDEGDNPSDLEVISVDARVAGATSDGLRPDPIRTGARNAPPPSP